MLFPVAAPPLSSPPNAQWAYVMSDRRDFILASDIAAAILWPSRLKITPDSDATRTACDKTKPWRRRGICSIERYRNPDPSIGRTIIEECLIIECCPRS